MDALLERKRPPPDRGLWIIEEAHHASRSVNKKRSEICVSAFAYPEQSRSPAGGVLLWHQAEPSRKVAPRSEHPPISDCSDDGRGRDGADSGDGSEPSARVISLD